MSDRLDEIRRMVAMSHDHEVWQRDITGKPFPKPMRDAAEWLLSEVDRLRAESHKRILWNRRPRDGDPGSIDEIVVRRPEMVHIEQMDDTCWWIAIYLDGTDRYWMGNFTATAGMDFSEQEDAGMDWDRDDSHTDQESNDA